MSDVVYMTIGGLIGLALGSALVVGLLKFEDWRWRRRFK